MKKEPKQNFKAPQGYFESFNERLMDKIDKEESIIPKNDGFRVPDEYFESLPKTVFQKVEESETKVIALRSYRNFYYVAAAAAVLVFVFSWIFKTPETIDFEDLASTEISAYFENEDFEWSSYEIAEVLSVDGFDMGDMTTDPLNEEQVLQYLEENVADFEELNLNYDELEE